MNVFRQLQPAWQGRARRATELAQRYPFARQVLEFYGQILTFQERLYDCLKREIEGKESPDGPPAFAPHSLDPHLPLLLGFFPSFLSLIKQAGTNDLSRTADRLLNTGSTAQWEGFLKQYWERNLDTEIFQEDPTLLFFPKAFLQPYAELLARKCEEQGPGNMESWQVRQGGAAVCPLCARPPQVGVLRAEGEGAKRSLVCSLCATEWRYKRVCCPACGEENFSRLGYSRASDFPQVRVDVCESCKNYLKSIDLTADGHAVPSIDDVASLPLDLWAVEQGYHKIELNLVGL